MKNKLKYLTKESLKKKFKSKWFIVVNIILIISLPLIINIDNVIKMFGGDFLEPTKIYVVDNTDYIYDNFEKSFNSTNKIVLKDENIKLIKSNKNYDKLKNEVKEKKKNIIVVIDNDKENVIKSKIVSYKTIDAFLYQNIINSLNTTKKSIALSNSNIDKNELFSINKNINIEREYLSKGSKKDNEITNTISKFVIPAFIVPFFFLILLVVQMIGAEINDEKTSRSMEIIISSIPAKIHFASKMIAVNVFVIVQGLLLILYSILGIGIRLITTKEHISSNVESFASLNEIISSILDSSIIHDVIVAIPFTIILFILSFIAYSLFAGILASITTSIEDFSQLQTPLMIIMMLGYYLAVIASVYESSLFIKITAFIPLISAIVAPVLLMLGQFSIIEFIISCLLVLLLNYLLVKYGLRIYKVGILNYSSNKLWKKMFKALKNKDMGV